MKPDIASGAAAYEQVRSDVIPALQAQFGEVLTELPTPFEMPQLGVRPDAIHAVCAWLRDRGFNLLVDVGGVDYLPRDPRFEVIYHLMALPQLWRLRLRVQLAGERPEVDTVSDLWPAANPAEREVFDQFGVRFRGHPNLARILNPDDWEGHPLRKDYPLRGPRDLQQPAPAQRNVFFPFKE